MDCFASHWKLIVGDQISWTYCTQRLRPNVPLFWSCPNPSLSPWNLPKYSNFEVQLPTYLPPLTSILWIDVV